MTINFLLSKSVNQMNTSKTRCLELQFRNRVAFPVLTGQEIKGEGLTPFEVALVDPLSNKVVDSEPEASAEVEIVALKGDFGDVQAGNWTSEEFDENIVSEREDILAKRGERPERKRKLHILGGNILLNLNKGRGCLRNIKFRQYSIWCKTCKFKLGARIPFTLSGIRIKEAVSEPFMVQDRRNTLYKKHRPPSLESKVWRLEKIGKDGAFHKRLSNGNVKSVKDFLTMFFLDPSRLRNILGTSMSALGWEATVSHARTCVLDKKLYLYQSSGSQQKKVVVFTVVGQVMWFFTNDQLISSEKLSETEKADAHDLVLSAFRHWNEVDSVEDEASLTRTLLCLPTMDDSSTPPDGRKSLTVDACGHGDYPESSTSSAAPLEGLICVDDYIPVNDADVGIDQPMSIPVCDMDSMAQYLIENENLLMYNPDSFHLQNLFLGSFTEQQSGVVEHPVPLASARRRWKMVLGVVRWFSIKRIVAFKHLCCRQKMDSLEICRC